VRIVGAGLSKTGTNSLHSALCLLGLKSLHHDDRRLNDVIAGKSENPDFRVYDDLDAVLDIPSACFYEELLAVYPDAKCILTVRAEGDWWTSIERHFNSKAPVESEEKHAFKWALRNFVYGSATAKEYLFRKRYREHNERVQARIPSSRLLVMDIAAGDGWEKLCPFLEEPIPPMPFPHRNPRGEEDPRNLRRAVSDIENVIPDGTTFILVDNNTFHDETFGDRSPFPFLEREGEYWGLPADDAVAIEELHRLRRLGASHMGFAWTAFWWLDHYVGLTRYLWSHFPCLFQNDRVVIFDLQRYAKEALFHAYLPGALDTRRGAKS
jgi:hypothetical protein